MADALQGVGLRVQAVPFSAGSGLESTTDSSVAEVVRGLGRGDGVLVWADPLSDDGDRTSLDEVLRRAESAGVWVSARPDVVDRVGTKEVLFATRNLGWGSDVRRYRTVGEFHRDFPARLAACGVRVLKASRGNGGRTVWKVALPGGRMEGEPEPAAEVVVQHAQVRDGASTSMTLAAFMELIGSAGAFTGWGGTGSLVDQEFVPGISRGIVRCYLVGGAVVGFARQYPAGVIPDGPLQVLAETEPPAREVMGLPSPKTMYPADEPALAGLRSRLERAWVPQMARVLGLGARHLPALWDIDVIHTGAPTRPDAADEDGVGEVDRFVLCEINASSVIPYPDAAPEQVARHVATALVDAAGRKPGRTSP